MNVIRAFLALPLAVLFSAMVRRVSPAFTLYTLHSTLYTLRPTQAFPPSVMCTAVARRVSRVSVSIRARLWAVHLPATCCVLPVVWQYSRLFPFAPVAVLCS